MLPGQSNALLPATIGSAITIALDTYGALAELGEEIEEEWQYVQDIADAWRERLAALDVARGGEELLPAVAAAVGRLCDEAALIADRHRAIDWLSTFPQVLLVALGELP